MTRTATEQTRSAEAHARALELIDRAVNLPAAELAEWRGQVAELLNRIEIGRLGRHHRTLDASTPTADLIAVTDGAKIRVLVKVFSESGPDGVSGQWDADAIKALGALARIH